MASDSTLAVAKGLLKLRAEAKWPLPSTDMGDWGSRFEELLQNADEAMRLHGASHAGKAEKVVITNRDELSPLIGGMEGGGSWKLGLSPAALWAEVKLVGGGSIAKIKPSLLRDKHKNLHTSWRILKARWKFFNIPEDNALVAEIDGLLKNARVTLVEHHLMVSLLLSLTDARAGKDGVNAQVRGFEMSDIKPSDLHEALWACCNKVTSGDTLEEYYY